MVRGPYRRAVHRAARIARLAAANWSTFDGACALRGVDPLALEPARFNNAFTVWLHGQIAQMEEGEQTWAGLVAWLNAPAGTPATAVVAAIAGQQEADAWDTWLSAGR